MKRAAKNKEANEHLVSEVAVGHPVRICNFADIGHGQKTPFWDGVALALKDREETFPGGSFPSGKTCQAQFDKLLAMQVEYKKNHKWKSGSTEDIGSHIKFFLIKWRPTIRTIHYFHLGEVASGLEEILEQIEEAADHVDLDREAKEGAAAQSALQDAELTRARVTPKSNKKTARRPEPEGDPVPQKDTLDSMLIKVLAKKCDDTTNSVERDRKHVLEERKMKFKEDELTEAKRVRLVNEVEARTAREDARADAMKRDEMTNAILKLALEAMSKK